MDSQLKTLFSSSSFLNDLVDLAVDAGRAIMEIYQGDHIEVTGKADDSPLTLADLASHRVIVAGLHKLTPDIPVLSEEAADIAYAERQNWVRYWLIDPLDGTKEFIKRNGEFTVNIALIENGVPILGVVHAPALNVCYYAAPNLGAFVRRDSSEPQAIKVSYPDIGETLKVVASRSHRDARTETLLANLDRYECISMGSSLKLCLVAEGAAHFYPRLAPTMEWDTAAAHAVVNEAGGVVCDLSLNVLRYNKEDMHNPEFLVLPENSPNIENTLLRQMKPSLS